jgi:hypothetical protein
VWTFVQFKPSQEPDLTLQNPEQHGLTPIYAVTTVKKGKKKLVKDYVGYVYTYVHTVNRKGTNKTPMAS